MQRRVFLSALGSAALLQTPLVKGQDPVLSAKPASGLPQALDPNAIFVCPMDPDVRQHDPGTCPRCGMKLAQGLPEHTEYEMDLTVAPRAIRPGQPIDLAFAVHDPWKHRQVTKFQVVHERLFHMFVLSQDLEYFLHDHPVFRADGAFHFDKLVLPKAGMYRVLGDFYPDAATPQLITKTIFAAGDPPPAPKFDLATRVQKTENLRVDFHTAPEKPIAAVNTQLHFKLTGDDGISGIKNQVGLEQYLGAWGHMLVASDDAVDLIHTHPFIYEVDAEGGPEVQFNMVFPRPDHNYRVWVQFQRKGVVNTARFDVRAYDLR